MAGTLTALPTLPPELLRGATSIPVRLPRAATRVARASQPTSPTTTPLQA